MRVKFLGFRFECSSVISLKKYFKAIEAENFSTRKLGIYERYYLANTTFNPKYFVGLFVTVKDQKKFCELTKKKGKLCIKVNNLKDNSTLMHFNFFVMNKETGFGLFQHYHNSCSANQFGLFNNRIYNSQKKVLLYLNQIKKIHQSCSPKIHINNKVKP